MARLLSCFSGGGPRHAEWGSSGHLGHMAGATARGRLLEAVEEELGERAAALGPLPPAARASQQDAALMRRLYKFNLPPAEMAHGRELLSKVAAIDAARATAEGDARALAAQLKAAELAHRQAEFARARAEAIATARGEALMHAQQATREAEMQQMALADTLQQALAQLGIELTPSRPTPLVTPMLEGGAATTPPAVRQSMFSAQQLAVVAASLSKLPNPRQSQHWAAAEAAAARAAAIEAGDQQHDQPQQNQEQRQLQYEGQQQLEEQEAAQRRQRASREAAEAERQRRRASTRASREQRQASGDGQSGAGSRGQQLSGFTVYTNSLQSEGGGAGDDHEVAHHPARASQPTLRHSASAPASGGDRDSQGSGVQWRSISSAALSSRSHGSEPGAGDGADADTAAVHSQRASRAGARHQQQERASLRRSLDAEAAAGGWGVDDEGEDDVADRLQQHARQLSKLVLPGLDASQLDSLVRIGASQASPDPHRQAGSSVEVLQQLLPPGWAAASAAQMDGVNPLQSEPGAELLLRELHAEWQRQSLGASAGGARPASRPGSRRASQEGRPPLAASVAAAPARPEAPVGARGRRAGSEPLGLLQVPVFDGKVPGAGTWVSPSMAAVLARKAGGRDPLLDGGEPSPPSHIKAVFGAPEDRDFYGPMAAHLNKQPKKGAPLQQQQQQQQQQRAPTSTSAESIRGPSRQQPLSGRSSLDGPAEIEPDWDRRRGSQPTAGEGAAAPQPPDAHAEERRQAALLHRFQPQGQSAQPPAPGARSQHPRRSNVALQQQGPSHRGGAAADHDLAASSALGRSAVRGSGLPPRRGAAGASTAVLQQSQQQQQASKRLDGARASVGRTGAASIKASLNAVEQAMAKLRDANPHLSQQHAPAAAAQHAPVAQSQPYGRVRHPGAGAGGAQAQRAAVHHTRTRSMPEATLDDLPLHELTGAGGQERRRREAAQAARAAGYLA